MRKCLFLGFFVLFPWFAVGETSFLPDSEVVVGFSKDGQALPITAARACIRDSRSYIYVAYADSEGIYVKRSADQGRTWFLLDTLNYLAPFAQYSNPSVAILPGDTLFVAWEEGYVDTNSVFRYDIFVCRFDGAVWTSPEAISYSAPGGNSAHNPCLASGPVGHVHCVWQSQNRGVWYAEYQGGIWSPPENIAPGGLVTFPSLVADTLGDVHLIYAPNRISYMKRTSGVWGPMEYVSPSSGTYPTIVVDRSNYPHVLYYAGLDSFNADIFYQFKGGSGWSSPYNVSNNFGLSKRVSLSIDVSDHLYASWEDNARDTAVGRQDIFYSTRDTSWSFTVAITDTPFPPNYCPSIGLPVTSEGVDVVWNRMLGLYRYEILYRRLPPLGSGVEEGQIVLSSVFRLPFSVTPNPFVSHVTIPGHEREAFALYDVAGRKVGVFKGDRIGLGLSAGIYFLKPEGKDAKPLRIVKLR